MFKPYRYEKNGVRFTPTFTPPNITLTQTLTSLRTHLREILPAILIFSGVGLLCTQLVTPSLTLSEENTKVVDPGVVLGETSEKKDNNEENFSFLELARQESQADGESNKEPSPPIFFLSIPKLGIEKAEVETNSTNLRPDKKIGHYKDSALPGETGSTFLYGHSVLPWFFNPKNYLTIFSTLPDLKPADLVTIDFGNSLLTYRVETLKTLNPEEVNPLERPDKEGSYLTLMTCVPPGLKTKRLLVVAKLEKKGTALKSQRL